MALPLPPTPLPIAMERGAIGASLSHFLELRIVTRYIDSRKWRPRISEVSPHRYGSP